MPDGPELRWQTLSQAEGLVVHGPDGAIVDANPVAERLLGVSRSRMIGSRPDAEVWDRLRTIDGRVLPADQRPASLALHTGEAVEDQLLVVDRGDGDPRVLRVQARIHPAGVSVGGCVVSFIDVTAEVGVAGPARRPDDETQRVTISVGAFVFVAAAQPDGIRFTHVSAGPTELLGSPAVGETLASAARRVLTPGQDARMEEMCEAMGAGQAGAASFALADGERWIRVRWVPHPDGDGSVVDGIVIETTSNRERERELVGLHSLVEMSGDLIALADLHERVTFLNQAGRRLLELDSSADMTGLGVADLLAPDAARGWQERELTAILTEGGWHGDSTLRVPATGQTIPVQGSSYLIHDPLTGEPMGIARVRRDVSAELRVADEQRAITEIATAIAEGADQDPLLDAITQRAMAATGRRAAAMVRASGTSRELVARAGDAARLGVLTGDEQAGVRAPITVHGRSWGWLVVDDPQRPPAPGVEESLQRFANLAATALLTCQTRARLMAQATTDFVTGLSNHRAFQQRLSEETSRANRSGEPLALVVFDLDEFKDVNDQHGHPLGDEVLRDLGQVLRMETRSHDMAARIGGDEFAMILPGAGAVDAAAIAVRCRDSFAASARARGLQVGISAGVADRDDAIAPEEMLRLADGALYWAKRHGPGVVVYDEGVVRELSARERAESLERTQVVSALRVLARVTDLKDPSTHQHSARVAALAQRLAAAAGWSLSRQAQLHEAGLVHDVGKLVVADAILAKPGRLTSEEYEEVKRHAALGADIAAGALAPEQVRWIREHHERPDGGGYPDGLTEERISDGAQLLALADTWDVMTTGRSYQAQVTGTSALAECRGLVGHQFTAFAVDALARCWDAGETPFT